MHIREMTLNDYEVVLCLMKDTEGITIRQADSKEGFERYLNRNPGFSFIAEDDGNVTGCVMCGHDGRRGYLQHLVVKPEYRRRGTGNTLVKKCLDKLAEIGIYKTHIDVLTSNKLAIDYWTSQGWKLRNDILRFSFTKSGDENI